MAVVAVSLLARRFEGLPPSVALVAGGVVVGILPFTPEVRLDPDGVGVGLLQRGIDRHCAVIDRLIIAEAELHLVGGGADVLSHTMPP